MSERKRSSLWNACTRERAALTATTQKEMMMRCAYGARRFDRVNETNHIETYGERKRRREIFLSRSVLRLCLVLFPGPHRLHHRYHRSVSLPPPHTHTHGTSLLSTRHWLCKLPSPLPISSLTHALVRRCTLTRTLRQRTKMTRIRRCSELFKIS